MKVFKVHFKRHPVKLTRDGWEYETVEREVRVLAEAEGYAMVRVKGGAAFAVPIKELSDK